MDFSGVLSDFVAADAEHIVAELPQVSIPNRIPATAHVRQVFAAIDFDDELDRQANEVDGIRADRILAAELLAEHLGVPHHLPNARGKFVRQTRQRVKKVSVQQFTTENAGYRTPFRGSGNSCRQSRDKLVAFTPSHRTDVISLKRV